MNLGETFNLNDLPQSAGFEPLPPGWYDVTVTEVEGRSNDNGWNGLGLKLDVEGPTHQGRVVFGNITIRHSGSDKAQQIGREQLGSLMRAGGLKNVSDSDQLIGIRCRAKLKISKSEKYGEQNDVVAYAAREGSQPQQAQQVAPAQQSGGTSWGAFK